MNVQFAGFLPLKNNPGLPPGPAFTYMNLLLYSIWGLFNNSCATETPRALPVGAIILHLRQFGHVWCVVVRSVFTFAEFKTLLFIVLLAFCILGRF